MKTDETETVFEVCVVACEGGHNIPVIVNDCSLFKLEFSLTPGWYLKK